MSLAVVAIIGGVLLFLLVFVAKPAPIKDRRFELSLSRVLLRPGPIALGVVALLVLTYLVKNEQWGTTVTPTVYNTVNPAINKLFNYALLPSGPKVGDGFVPEPQHPTNITRLGGGGVEVTFPAEIGFFRTGLLHSWRQGGLLVEVVDSTFIWKGDRKNSAVTWSVGGMPFRGRKYRPLDSPFNAHSLYIKADMPSGGLFIRQGTAQPRFVGAGRHLLWRRQNFLRRAFPDPDAEILLGINVPQAFEQQQYMDGSITVRLTPVPNPGAAR